MTEPITAATIPPGWEAVSEHPPTFPECGACYGLLTLIADAGPPYGYCPACESYTTWAMVNRGH